MKILLIGNYPPDRQESMQRFAVLMQRELQGLGHEVKLLLPQPKFNRAGAPPAGKAKWFGYIDKYLLFPTVLKKESKWADIVHICDHSNAPYVRAVKSKPHLITCHDVLAIKSALGHVPQNKTGFSGKLLQNYILGGLNKAQHIACVSEQTKRELLEVSTLSEAKVDVIYNSLNYDFKPMDPSEAKSRIQGLLGREALAETDEIPPFVFHIGGNQWYKNRQGVIRIFDHVHQAQSEKKNLRLVMVGKEFTSEMKEEMSKRKLEKYVIELNDCENEDVRALYSSAQLLLFPSLAEGFGWPIIEAQACGCRVVTTNVAPMTEVGGDAAVYCDPTNEPEAAVIVTSVLNENVTARNERIENGLNRAKLFSPGHMAQTTLDVYNEVISKKVANSVH